jgi:methionine synthase II (cobalamin-independent)
VPDDEAEVTTIPRGSASGIGSLPGTDVAWAMRVVREVLAAPAAKDDSVPAGVPFLPELPHRGPGADLVGRAAVRLVDLPVDLQPSGWRLVERPGHDMRRAEAFWREDLDRLAEALDGWTGPLKVQLAGPWTLAATLWLPRGERAVSDVGARRDLVSSSAEAVRVLAADLLAAVPGAQLVVQLDEPSLPAVLDGALPTASGLHTARSVPAQEVADGLALVVAAARGHGATTLVHCCADDPPIAVLRRSGADALSLDTRLLTPSGWESVAAAVEDGVGLWAGCVPAGDDSTSRSDGAVDGPADVSTDELSDRLTERLADGLTRAWRQVGLELPLLADLVVTPACGLAGVSPARAVQILRATVAVQQRLASRAAD